LPDVGREQAQRLSQILGAITDVGAESNEAGGHWRAFAAARGSRKASGGERHPVFAAADNSTQSMRSCMRTRGEPPNNDLKSSRRLSLQSVAAPQVLENRVAKIVSDPKPDQLKNRTGKQNHIVENS
jgi:hypothetical protein